MESGMNPISCPVCTLYMREGVTLQNHLDTHPKDQVIAALVRMSAGSSKENQSNNESMIVPTSTSSQDESQPSSSHFTTAITYQQFLSSNGSTTNTLVPQYVSMPTILSAPNTGPTPFMQMLYNPYVIQQQQQQQQQQFQLLSSVTSPSQYQQAFVRHVAPPSPYPSHHVSQPQVSLSSQPVPYQTGGFPAEYSSQGFQNNTNNASSVLSLPSTSSFSATTLSSPVSEGGNFPPTVNEHEEQDPPDKPDTPSLDKNIICSISSEIVHCSKQQITEEEEVPVECSFPDENVTISVSCDGGVETRTSSTQCENEDQKSPYVAKDEDNEEVPPVAAETSDVRQEESLRTEAVNVRVRKDLNDVAVSPMVRSHDVESTDKEVEEETSPCHVDDDMSQLSGIIRNALRIQPPPISVPNNDEYITSDREYSEEDKEQPTPIKETTKDKKSDDTCKTGKEDGNSFLDLDSSETVNIIEIDGIHILVPSQFLDDPASVLGGKLPADDPVVLSISPEEEEVSQPETTTMPSLNIQTDETMPPRGELSEQESVGGNDSSVWVQAFQGKEVSTSYDLLARESWEASDGSDVEIDIEIEAVGRQQKSEMNGSAQKKTRGSGVYRCSTCEQPFNCPKERRVHHSTHHSDKSGNGEVVASVSGNKEDNVDEVRKPQVHKRKARVKKTIKEEEEDIACVKTERPLFMEVFLKEDTETKMEMEEEKEELPAATTGQASVIEVETEEMKQEETSVATEFPCNLCQEVFTSSKLQINHERRAHKKPKDKKNMCATCKEVFSTESEYQRHLQTHPLECSQCGKYFYRRQNLDLHLKRHLGIKPHKCTICDKAFVTKQKLAEHTNSHTGNAPIKCPMCDETFRRYSNLIQHKHRHHMNVKKKVKDFICHCGEIFHTKKKLEWHKEIHEEKPKCCTYCSERFVHASSLTRHIRKAHDCRYVPKCGREVENVECTVCGYVFLKSSLQVHMRMHSGERPYSCHVCGKDFTTKWNLQLHRWTHAARSTKPFKCSLCKSAFFRRNDYTAHMHSHRNVRPYTCNHCGCQFIRKYNCLRHVREHEVGKSFSCNVCGKMFHRSYYLKEHLRVHSGARPFACHICGKASSTKSNHNKHVKIHHAREPVNTEG